MRLLPGYTLLSVSRSRSVLITSEMLPRGLADKAAMAGCAGLAKLAGKSVELLYRKEEAAASNSRPGQLTVSAAEVPAGRRFL